MQTKLQKLFPLIRSRQEVLAEINSSSELKAKYDSWKTPEQQEFLDFCTGVRGIKLLYNGFAREILNPEVHPDRLESILKGLLGKPVRICSVLPNDSDRLGDENALVILDIVVKLEDGRYANVEIQRIGYDFPGQRTACYGADLLLRQYKKTKGISGKNFSYLQLNPVYTIVMMEQSPAVFHDFPDQYIHKFRAESDTGIALEHLQNYIYIPLDIFLQKAQNDPVSVKKELDEWLLLLSSDRPEVVEYLAEKSSRYRDVYHEAYDICRNMEVVMGIFSEELKIMDRNMVQYMIQSRDEKIQDLEEMIGKLQETNTSQGETISSQNERINSQNETINSQNETINNQNETINSQNETINSQDKTINSLQEEIMSLQEELMKLKQQIQSDSNSK